MLLVNQIRWEFISSDEEFVPSDCESVQLCVLSSYSIISIRCINKPLSYQSPTLGPTLYKFIVTGLLGLDPSISGAQFENRDPTINAVCGKVVYAMMGAVVC